VKSWLHEHGAQREHWLIRKISGGQKGDRNRFESPKH